MEVTILIFEDYATGTFITKFFGTVQIFGESSGLTVCSQRTARIFTLIDLYII